MVLWFLKTRMIYLNMKNGAGKIFGSYFLYITGILILAASLPMFPTFKETKALDIVLYLIIAGLGIWNFYHGFLISKLEKDEKKKDKL